MRVDKIRNEIDFYLTAAPDTGKKKEKKSGGKKRRRKKVA
jgi:hypothetical protein